MTKTKKPTQTPIELAINVSNRVELRDVQLIRCDCSLFSLPSERDNSHDVTGFAEFQIDEKNKTVFVFVHLDLQGYNNEGEELTHIGAVYFLTYAVQDLEGLTQEDFQQFANYNGVFNAWPYWREFVNSMTARFNLPPLTWSVYRYGNELPRERKSPGMVEGEVIPKKVTKKKSAKKATPKKVAKKKTAKKKASKKKTAR